MKIVVLDGYTENPGDLSWEGFAALGELTVHDRTPPELIAQRIGDAPIVITNKTPISAQVIQTCPGIKYIGLLSTGYNSVNLHAAKQRGIPVCNIPSYGTASVAQMVFALLLEICHHPWKHSEAVKAGEWRRRGDFCFWLDPLIELSGKTMGIIGLGKIGQAVARIASAMGMKVIAHDAHQNITGKSLAEYVSLHELLKRSDVVSLHCPLFPATHGLINRDAIALMKDGAILINTARGQLVIEPDLADALNSGKLYAAGLDVMSSEPVESDNPLLTARNCIITPHIAWAPLESRMRLMETAVSNLRAFLDGAPENVVY